MPPKADDQRKTNMILLSSVSTFIKASPPSGISLRCRRMVWRLASRNTPKGSRCWLRDAEAIADPSPHEGLGPVHPGFFAGLPELWTRLKPRLTQKPCNVAGHSLGAARASLFTGLMVLDGKPPVRDCALASPGPASRRPPASSQMCAAAPVAMPMAGRTICSPMFRSRLGSRITCIRRRSLRSARRRAMPTCSATFSSPGTRCGCTHRQPRSFRSSKQGAAGVTKRPFGVLRSIKYSAEDAKHRREYHPP